MLNNCPTIKCRSLDPSLANIDSHLLHDVGLDAPKKRSAPTSAMTTGLNIAFLVFLMAVSSPCFAFGWFGDDLNGRPCTGHPQGYGPFDYTNPANKKFIHVVEIAHFLPYIEKLQHGRSGTLGAELNYTLLAVPNHHRALYSVIRYELNYKKNTLLTPPECYLQRALAFKPDDAVVHMLYGLYLHRKDRYTLALEQYQAAEKLDPTSAELHYNLGLLYCELKEYQKALAQAHLAYAKDYPLSGLRKKLQKAGVWQNKSKQANKQ